MVRIAVISDTHGFLDDKVIAHMDGIDEIWHAGDIGTLAVLERLREVTEIRAVYGNIDDRRMRNLVPEVQDFTIERQRVLITHIAGYPGRYNPEALKLIKERKPDIFICGHSHILKILFDKKSNHLHINPGAAGKYGLHKIRTLVRFVLDKGKISGMEIVEMDR